MFIDLALLTGILQHLEGTYLFRLVGLNFSGNLLDALCVQLHYGMTFLIKNLLSEQ